MTLHLGIDLGTSNSAVCGIRDGKPVVFKTPEGPDVMPSVIHRDRRGNQTVGVRAYELAGLAPENCVQGFKRLMGTATPLGFASTGDSITPEQASAEILKALVGTALVESGAQGIAGTVITIPAAFNQMQCEATLAAARAAGLERVALLQEPVAAALAAMAASSSRNGTFLVFDIGGGTFDVALVHATDGEVTVLAHEGVNMLGGRDFDRLVVDNVVTPWLLRTFRLPRNFQVEKRYERLIRLARRAAETAKIELSSRGHTSVNADETALSTLGDGGEPIYIDVPLSRAELEQLIEPKVTEAIALCRKVLADNGYTHEDVERIVLIGGPTKMPGLRRRAQDELGIAVEDVARVDPMTAVAIGAAIYCEGRDWQAAGSTVKASRETVAASGGEIAVELDVQARTAASTARMVARLVSGDRNAEIQVDDPASGTTTGRRSLRDPVTLDLPLPVMGRNAFRVFVFDALGRPVQSATRDVLIERLLASAGGVPATQTIAVKVLDENGSNTLQVLVPKGTELPARGKARFLAAGPLRPGDVASFRFELFEMNDETLKDPELNLAVGEFRISSEDLPEGQAIRRGDEILVHWEMNNSQAVAAEVEIPAVGQRFDRRNFYDFRSSAQSFAGTEGAALVGQVLDRAESELERAEAAVPASVGGSLQPLRARLEALQSEAATTVEPDLRRSINESVRFLRQSIAAATAHPEARLGILRRSLDDEVRWYGKDVRLEASEEENDRVDTLARNARRFLDQGDANALDLAARAVGEISAIYWRAGMVQPGFCGRLWRSCREDRHLAKDRAAFDRLVAQGDLALAKGDLAGVRAAFFALMDNAISVGPQRHVGERSSLMRG